jgi:hypothetical protein
VLSVYGVYCASMCASHDRISISVAPLSEVKTTSEEKTVKMRYMNSVVWMEVYKCHPRRWCRRLVGRIVHAQAGERLVSLPVHPRR